MCKTDTKMRINLEGVLDENQYIRVHNTHNTRLHNCRGDNHPTVPMFQPDINIYSQVVNFGFFDYLTIYSDLFFI